MKELNDAIINAFKSYLESSRISDDLLHNKKDLKYYASDMGKCYRMRWLKRKGIKGLYTWKTYYTFEHGNYIHKLGYKALEAAGMLAATEQTFGDDHFSGRYDGKIEFKGKNYMFDFKSTAPYPMKKLETGTDNIENIMQVLCAIMFERKKDPKIKLEDMAVMVYINKLPTKQYSLEIILPKDYHLSTYQAEIQEDMDKMIDYWLTDKVPPCTCPSWSNQEYNSYWLFCKMSEKDVKKHLDYVKNGNIVSSDGFTIDVVNPLRKEAE